MDYIKIPSIKGDEKQVLNINNNRSTNQWNDVTQNGGIFNLHTELPENEVRQYDDVRSVSSNKQNGCDIGAKSLVGDSDLESEIGTTSHVCDCKFERPHLALTDGRISRPGIQFESAENQSKRNGGKLSSAEKFEDCDVISKSEISCQFFLVIFARLLYLIHGLLTVWRVAVVLGNIMWLLSIAAGFLFIETLYVLIKRKGKETQWFQPAVLMYLLWIVPCIWLLEVEKTARIQLRHNSSFVLLGDIVQPIMDPDAPLIGYDSTNDWWGIVMSQSALVVMLLCRWLIPRGNLTRDQLSIVLLYYLGTASDIVDFFNVLSEDEIVLLDMKFFFTVLVIWSWSLFQFVFTSVEPSPDNLRQNSVSPESKASDVEMGSQSEEWSKSFKKRIQQLTQGETWIIFGSVIMQDGPYAIVRLITLFHWNIHTYTNFLYTLKNILMLALQVYRMIVVYHHYTKEKRILKQAAKKRRESMWREALLKSTVLLSFYDQIETKASEEASIKETVTSPENIDQTLLNYVLKNQHRVSVVSTMTDIST